MAGGLLLLADSRPRIAAATSPGQRDDRAARKSQLLALSTPSNIGLCTCPNLLLDVRRLAE